ncbi:MAG: hypothetical protein KAJ07_13115, partial [Planctomycetes bacterium]|nr:hypothetical protein [Planctomycetota bacterium]
WLGAEDANAVLNILTASHIPAEPVIEEGRITSFKIDQVYVRAYVDYLPFLGSSDEGVKDTWIPLAPAFKLNPRTQVPDQVKLDTEEFLEDIKSLSLVDNLDSYVTALPEEFISDKITSWASEIIDLSGANNLTRQTIFSRSRLDTHKFGIFPGSLPYEVLTHSGAFNILPDTLRAKINISVLSPESEPVCEYTAPVCELSSKRISISYVPADEDSLAVLTDYLAEPELPVYLIELLPQINIGGEAKAVGLPVSMGSSQQLSISVQLPFEGPQVVTNNIRAGGIYAVTLNEQNTTESRLSKHLSVLENIYADLSLPDTSPEEIIGQLLYCAGLNYFYQSDKLDRITADSLGVLFTRQISETLTSFEPDIRALYGAPYMAVLGPVKLQLIRNVLSPASRSGSLNAEKRFTSAAGMTGTVLSST